MVKNCDLGLENAFTILQPSLQIIQLKIHGKGPADVK